MPTMKTSEFAEFITMLCRTPYQTEAYYILETSSKTETDEEFIFTFNSNIYEIYGHLRSLKDIEGLLSLQGTDLVVNGSKPIHIDNRFMSFGEFDDVVSPRMRRIVLELHDILKNKPWNLKFTFNTFGDTYIRCDISGEVGLKDDPITSANYIPHQAVKTVSGVTFGPDIGTALDFTLASLPQIVGGG